MIKNDINLKVNEKTLKKTLRMLNKGFRRQRFTFFLRDNKVQM